MEEGRSEGVGTGRVVGCMEKRGGFTKGAVVVEFEFPQIFSAEVLWAGMGMNVLYARLKLHEFYFIRE